jgi:hypothetical protein
MPMATNRRNVDLGPSGRGAPPAAAYAAAMRFPNDTALHLRMAALVVGSLCLEHLAATRLPHWSSPQIGIVTFVLGLSWVALAAFHHARATQDRIRVLEAKLERVTALAEALADDQRGRRALPKL